MAELKKETKSTFEGSTFNKVPLVAGKKEDGLNPSLSIYIEENGNTLLVVRGDSDVVLKVIGDGLTVIDLIP